MIKQNGTSAIKESKASEQCQLGGQQCIFEFQ
jgi:hypothetical protein